MAPSRARLAAGLSVRQRSLMIKEKCFVYIFHFHFLIAQLQKVDFLRSQFCDQNWVAVVRLQINRTLRSIHKPGSCILLALVCPCLNKKT